MTDPPMVIGNPLCTDWRETLFLGLLLLGQGLDDFLLLDLEGLLPELLCFLDLGPTSLSLGAGLVGLQLVDVLQENLLVFGDVPFDLQAQAEIHMLVNLLGFTVSPVKSARELHPSHTGHLPWALEHWQDPSASLCPFACPSEPKCFSSIEPGNGQSQASGCSAHL